MNLFLDQTRTRAHRDEQELEESYANLAASITRRIQEPLTSVDDTTTVDAAAADVLAYFGISSTPEIPDNILEPLDRLTFALRPHGIMRRACTLEGHWWKDATGAYIAELKDTGVIAIVPRGIRGYCYRDPKTRKLVRVGSSTVHAISEKAICLYRPLPPEKLAPRDLFSFMMHSLDAIDYIYVTFITAISTLIGLLPAVVSNLLFKRIIPAGLPELIAPIAGLMVGLTVSRSLINVCGTAIRERLEGKLRIQMEAATYARLMLLPSSFFRTFAPGELARRVDEMPKLVENMVSSFVGIGLKSVFSLAYLFQIFAYAPQLTLASVFVVVAQVLAWILQLRADLAISRAIATSESAITGLTHSLIKGISKIKLAGAEKRAFSKWANAYADVGLANFDAPAIVVAGPDLIPLISVAGIIVIYFLAATSSVTNADFLSFNVAYGSVTAAMAALVAQAETISTIRPSIEMVEPIMQATPEQRSQGRQVQTLRGDVSLNRVTFSYAPNAPAVFDGLTLEVRKGEFVAVVGRTGCGKSTLTRLLLGFERPTRGAIYYDGHDLAHTDLRSLRTQIGVVTQNGALFMGDILTNIILTTPQATEEDAWEAAELAGIADDIRAMPLGMHTMVSPNSSTLSGGQRQRILIARAICSKPKVLILDEATSALDNITQRHVTEGLSTLRCTRIVIAHRLSTVVHADRIVVIDGGRIVEEGTYDELMKTRGVFADLVGRQRVEIDE